MLETQPHVPMTPDLTTLVRLFYNKPAELASFKPVDAADMPAPYAVLLAHDQHMTVTVEQFHASAVDVRVLARAATPTHYARKILLARQNDGRVVQYGIMRVNLAYLDPVVRRQIEAENTPLGRVLIEHNVLRRVRLTSLWHVTAGPDLANLCLMPDGALTYGRTALIEVNNEPAVELLEIVSPVA